MDTITTENYTLYNDDCLNVMQQLPEECVDLSIYSPPFAGLYQYSSDDRDLSNCNDIEEFLKHYEYVIEQVSRLTKPGRISAVHVTDINRGDGLYDFSGDVIKLHEKHGFRYRNRITIWKEPLKVRMRTMVRSLMHKLIVEDSTECFTAMPDYVLIFKKEGENKVPVQHPHGITTEYAGATPLLPAMEKTYGKWEGLVKKFTNWKDPKSNKLAHIKWQRYASSVWDDIRIDEVLKYKEARENEEEKHVHPLQLDVIDRLCELYSNPGEVVLTPFAGVGSEVYGPVSYGRKAIGIELKETYFRQMVENLKGVKSRFVKTQSLF